MQVRWHRQWHTWACIPQLHTILFAYCGASLAWCTFCYFISLITIVDVVLFYITLPITRISLYFCTIFIIILMQFHAPVSVLSRCQCCRSIPTFRGFTFSYYIPAIVLWLPGHFHLFIRYVTKKMQKSRINNCSDANSISDVRWVKLESLTSLGLDSNTVAHPAGSRPVVSIRRRPELQSHVNSASTPRTLLWIDHCQWVASLTDHVTDVLLQLLRQWQCFDTGSAGIH